jgi:hypothetical protein
LNKISFIDLDKWENEIIWSASGYIMSGGEEPLLIDGNTKV